MTFEDAQSLLRTMLGPEASFREGQWEAIEAAAVRRLRVLVVQRTGWGKSVVYFLATKILREAGAGPTLLISPLLSLMRNQTQMASRLGIQARTINSENVEQWTEVEAALRENACDVLMISPERLGNTDFLQRLLPLVQGKIGLFVVDEAHCISDWGHDFRPDYRRIIRILRSLPTGVPVLCTTATANDRVVRDIQSQIAHLQILRGPLVRQSLKLYNIKLPSQADRLAWLAQFVPQLAGSGIIYCLTIQDTRRVAEWLQRNQVNARAYHADLEGAERVQIEQQLIHNQLKALVATVALGMGFDKPDLGFVVHFQRPGSVVAYYQQVGRAGRAVESAYGILLSGAEDDEIVDYFIRTAFPPLEVLQAVLGVLERGATMTLDEIASQLNHSRGALEKALKLLEVDGAVTHEKHRWLRTANRWKADADRFHQVTQLRRAELEQIQRYVEHPGCLMEFLARALDDHHAGACGKCMNCTQHTARRTVPHERVIAAVQFLCGDALILEPRLRWPAPVLDSVWMKLPGAIEMNEDGKAKTTIPAPLRAQPGRILCVYGDAGWGPEVALGKYTQGVFSDVLVKAAADLILQHWQPQPAPEWVTAAPSLHHPNLVPDFAQRLATRLGLPFHPVLHKPRATLEQKDMQNSVQQVRNLLGAFEITGPVPPGPALLVDDVTDSGWTLSILGLLLRQHGSGPVHPFALAKASPRGS